MEQDGKRDGAVLPISAVLFGASVVAFGMAVAAMPHPAAALLLVLALLVASLSCLFTVDAMSANHPRAWSRIRRRWARIRRWPHWKPLPRDNWQSNDAYEDEE